MKTWRRFQSRCFVVILSIGLVSLPLPATVLKNSELKKPWVQVIRTPILSLNPFALTGIEPYSITNYVIEPLAVVDPLTKKLKPHLARNWTVEKDGTSVRVRLRPEALFHNGAQVLASDVRFTWQAYMDSQYQGGIWRPMWENVRSVRVLSSHEFEVRLKQADYQTFVNFMTTLRILPQAFYQLKKRSQWRAKMVGSGPFKLVRFNSGRSLDLVPFANWWGWKTFDLKSATSLRVKTVQDPHLIESLLQKGEADFFEARNALLSQNSPRHLPNPMKVEWIDSPIGEGFGIELNLKDPRFKDPRVREALILLWNRQRLIDKVYGSQFSVALDCFSPRLSSYPTGQPVEFDSARARGLLEQAGWRDRNHDSVLENAQGEKFEFKVLVTSQNSERWLNFYQEDARQVGVSVRIQRVTEDAPYWKKLKEGRFEAVTYEGGLADSVHESTWATGAPYNYGGFSSAVVDQNLSRLAGEFNETARLKMQGEMIAEIRKNFVRIPGLVSSKAQFWMSRNLVLDSEFPTLAWRWRRQD